MSVSRRFAACIARLGVSYALAARVLARDVAACQSVVERFEEHFAEAEPGTCCKPVFTSPADYAPPACEHLRRLWFAREYLSLAKAGAPAEGAWACTPGPAGISCHGKGGHALVRGHFENNVWKGTTMLCPRCHGKGYMTEADVKRNECHDEHYVSRMLFA
jgi:hypothetical protein